MALAKGIDGSGTSGSVKKVTATTSKPSIVSSITNAIKNAVGNVASKPTSTPVKTTAGNSAATNYLGGNGSSLPTSNAYAAANQTTFQTPTKTPTISNSIVGTLKNNANVGASKADFGTISMDDNGVTLTAGKDSPITKKANLQNNLLNPLGNTEVLKTADAISKLNSGVQAYDVEKLIADTKPSIDTLNTKPTASLTYDEIAENIRKRNGDTSDDDGNVGNVGRNVQGTVEDGYWNELLDAFLQDNEAQRDAAIQAILDNLGSVEKEYLDRIQEVIDQYDSLVDQNQVEKDKARRALRESQANRGNLDSGYGRQELLDMNLGYDNKTAELKAAKTKAVNEIYNLIEQAKAEAKRNQASVNSTYDQAALNARLNSMA